MTKEQKLSLIYRHTHQDYKGKIAGARTILTLRDGGTRLVELNSLTDAEIERELPYAIKQEAKRKVRAPTIYEALKAKLGREPSHEELCADVRRIIKEGAELRRAKTPTTKPKGRK